MARKEALEALESEPESGEEAEAGALGEGGEEQRIEHVEDEMVWREGREEWFAGVADKVRIHTALEAAMATTGV
jgi:hypothetical protein